MKQIRRATFETNSSSTHTLTMCTESQYADWVAGKLYYSRYGERFIPAAEVEAKWQKELEANPEVYDDKNEFLIDSGYYTFELYDDTIECDYETFEHSYTTESGEKVIAFGYYGYDG